MTWKAPAAETQPTQQALLTAETQEFPEVLCKMISSFKLSGAASVCAAPFL
jgi:hypothetical protein